VALFQALYLIEKENLTISGNRGNSFVWWDDSGIQGLEPRSDDMRKIKFLRPIAGCADQQPG
jgi:hypothetical protein